jgi:hypothetical protein
MPDWPTSLPSLFWHLSLSVGGKLESNEIHAPEIHSHEPSTSTLEGVAVHCEDLLLATVRTAGPCRLMWRIHWIADLHQVVDSRCEVNSQSTPSLNGA